MYAFIALIDNEYGETDELFKCSVVMVISDDFLDMRIGGDLFALVFQ
jgi:hypothetical protein